ncbi:hypothetical protein L208DRAFT_1375672 [Tricholoma matsutake]|nr:hypothetical protein L208DRAFT_1375672 [Tricholoma matsutake 945]
MKQDFSMDGCDKDWEGDVLDLDETAVHPSAVRTPRKKGKELREVKESKKTKEELEEYCTSQLGPNAVSRPFSAQVYDKGGELAFCYPGNRWKDKKNERVSIVAGKWYVMEYKGPLKSYHQFCSQYVRGTSDIQVRFKQKTLFRIHT